MQNIMTGISCGNPKRPSRTWQVPTKDLLVLNIYRQGTIFHLGLQHCGQNLGQLPQVRHQNVSVEQSKTYFS